MAQLIQFKRRAAIGIPDILLAGEPLYNVAENAFYIGSGSAVVRLDAGSYTAECTTAAATAAKVATCPGIILIKGVEVTVKFTEDNTVAPASLTLNINNTGAWPILYRGSSLPSASVLSANRVYKFYYNGTSWELIGDLDTTVGAALSSHTGDSTMHITSTERTNWNAAYGWGDHASAGYVLNTATIPVNRGGTGKTSIASGKMLYASTANTYAEVTTSSFGRGLLNAASDTVISGLYAANAEHLYGVRSGLAAWTHTQRGNTYKLNIYCTAGQSAVGAPANYAVGLSVESYYGFSIAAYGGDDSDRFWIRNNNNTWRTLTHSGNSNLSTVDWSAKSLTLAGAITGATTITASSTIQATTAKLTSLSDGYLPYHVSDASGLANSPIYTDGVNVGIGTTNPEAKLEIGGTTGGNYFKVNGASNYFSVEHDGNIAVIGASNTKLRLFDITHSYLEIIGDSGRLSFTNQNIGTTILIDYNGNVGIGTTSPSQKLDVAGGAIRTDNQLISTVATGTAPLAVSSTTLVSNLNADSVDGLHSTNIARGNQVDYIIPDGSTGWVRIAKLATPAHGQAYGVISISNNFAYNRPSPIIFSFGTSYRSSADGFITQIGGSGLHITKARLVSPTTADTDYYIEVYTIATNRNTYTISLANFFNVTLYTEYTAGSVPANYDTKELAFISDGMGANKGYFASNVGIGTTDPLGYKLYVSGTGHYTSNLSVGGTLGVTGNTTLSGTLILSATTSASQTGIIYKGSERFIHDFNYGNNGTVTTAGRNTFVGINAGNFTMGSTATESSHASYNTAIGYAALQYNTTGYYNTASGCTALYSNTTGSYNTASGHAALQSNTTGHYNTAIGLAAGRYLSDDTTGRTTGNYGTYIGTNTKASADGTTNETVIGYNAIGAGSNTVVLGSSVVTAVYLGSTSKAASLHCNHVNGVNGVFTGTLGVTGATTLATATVTNQLNFGSISKWINYHGSAILHDVTAFNLSIKHETPFIDFYFKTVGVKVGDNWVGTSRIIERAAGVLDIEASVKIPSSNYWQIGDARLTYETVGGVGFLKLAHSNGTTAMHLVTTGGQTMYSTGVPATGGGGGAIIQLNGAMLGEGDTAAFYAPTTAGANGNILKSNGSGAPSWVTMPEASLSVAGITTLGAAGGAAAYSHTHSAYSLTSHDHSGVYAASAHNHTGVYAPITHSHDYFSSLTVRSTETSYNNSQFILGNATIKYLAASDTLEYDTGIAFTAGEIKGAVIGNYGVCSTAASTGAKTVTISGFRLATGVQVNIKFSNDNYAYPITMNVSGTGAKTIKAYGESTEQDLIEQIKAGAIIPLVYDGTYWVIPTTPSMY